MPLRLGFKINWVREDSCCPPVWGASLAEERKGQLLQTLPPAASWQECGTTGLGSRGSTTRDSVAWILALSMSTSGLTWPLENGVRTKGSITVFKIWDGFMCCFPNSCQSSFTSIVSCHSKEKRVSSVSSSLGNQIRPWAPGHLVIAGSAVRVGGQFRSNRMPEGRQ